MVKAVRALRYKIEGFFLSSFPLEWLDPCLHRGFSIFSLRPPVHFSVTSLRSVTVICQRPQTSQGKEVRENITERDGKCAHNYVPQECSLELDRKGTDGGGRLFFPAAFARFIQ